jgi:hypothetical protein
MKLGFYNYTKPDIVYKKAKLLFNKNVIIKPSTRKDKKYMIFLNNNWIHFGQAFYEDYTYHQDEKRRNLFLKRNHLWKNASKYSPAYLSYNLLW